VVDRRQAKHDIFLSYSRKDEAVAKRLNIDLQARGVRTFLDQKDVDPGAIFEPSIFSELQASKSYGLVLTNNSLKSKWVSREYEYARDLLNRGEMRIIPLLFETVDLPDGLSLHSVIDFRAERKWTANLNSLVFPGITGKRLEVWMVNQEWKPVWRLLEERLTTEQGISTIRGGDVLREWYNGQLFPAERSQDRVVVVVNLFGGWAADEWRLKESLRFLFEVRERTRAKSNEVVFVLFHDPADMRANYAKLQQYVEQSKIERLRLYFQIDMTLDPDKLNSEIDVTWNKVLQELMKVEHLPSD
jgi:hypothetical protein